MDGSDEHPPGLAYRQSVAIRGRRVTAPGSRGGEVTVALPSDVGESHTSALGTQAPKVARTRTITERSR